VRSHGGGILCGSQNGQNKPGGAESRTWRYGLGGFANCGKGWVGGHWELGVAALLQAVWWNLHLASLLTHFCFSVFCLFLCTVTDFSAVEKDRGVKFCMHVGQLSGQVFSPLVNFGSRGVTGAAALLPE